MRDRTGLIANENRSAAVRRVLAALAVVALGACAAQPVVQGRQSAVQTLPGDPVAAFAATAEPGAEGRIVLADGRSEAVRLLRSYHAASGRQCRELLVGDRMASRTQLVCEAEGGAWAPVRPLLRGSGIARP